MADLDLPEAQADLDRDEAPKRYAATPRERLADANAARVPETSRFVWLGVMLMALGILALVFPFVSTLAATVFLSGVFVIAGLVKLWRALTTHPRGRAIRKAAWGAVYFLGGGLMLYAPLAGAWSLTIVLAALFIGGGIAAMFWAAAEPRLPGWMWMAASGLLSVVLGVVVAFMLPFAALWFPGVVAGVDLVSTAGAFLAMDGAARRTIAQGDLAAG